jgi:hypothetical protein
MAGCRAGQRETNVTRLVADCPKAAELVSTVSRAMSGAVLSTRLILFVVSDYLYEL